MKKPNEKRKEQDIEVLTKITEHINLFVDLNKFDAAGHAEICKHLYYKSYKQGEVIFEGIQQFVYIIQINRFFWYNLFYFKGFSQIYQN